MRDNSVTESGGQVASHCGAGLAGPVNIAAGLAPLRGRHRRASAMAPEGVTRRSFAGCIPGT